MVVPDSSLTPHPRSWLVKPVPREAEALAQDTGLPLLAATLLAQRGVTAEKARDFLVPRLGSLGDPFDLPEMRPLVQRLLRAVDERQQVLLYGDYDVDGVTSLSIIHLTLRAYGLQTHLYLPHRLEEGYGLSLDGLQRAFEKHGKPDLVLALDCGTTSLTETAWLRAEGVDCAIVDHHELSPAGRPDCVALVNPQLGSDHHYFCTAGLCFKVAHALMKARRAENFDLKSTLDLVALGTVADLVPLVAENRLLVRRGLEALAQTPRLGLRALKQIAGVDGLVQTHHVGFRLGPRLNAAGRLDTAFTSLSLLLTEDEDEAGAFAEQLELHNRERQAVEQRVFQEALSQLGNLEEAAAQPAVVLGSRDWHPGVIGIVASRISRLLHRPAILIAIDESGMGKGSGRSIPGFSLVAAIEQCRAYLERGGGHAMAAGVSVMEDQIPAFRQAFLDAAQRAFEDGLQPPALELDADVGFRDLTPEFLNHYRLLEPFGQRNPEPLFLVRGVQPRLPGQIMREKHLRLQLVQGGVMHGARWFHAPLDQMPPAPWDIALRIQRNFWRGEERWQFTIEDARPSVAD
ncbi:MAG: single-stranded-DNA-specific exonuclease RecJ [Verrucomicrobiales bacterium]|nr:single-stranded-DNA-specific exonuclease RecJ [Verrucomicrobiales bacterium]